MDSFIYGFLLGIGLIVSIGPQNLFLIEQASSGNRAYFCATVCAVCDATLIIISTLGIGHYLTDIFWVEQVFLAGGATFLLMYGYANLKKGWHSWQHASNGNASAPAKQRSLSRLLILTISFSLLNPHAWIDTIIIVGGASMVLSNLPLILFTLGAVFASICWFFMLAYVSKTYAHVISSPRNAAILAFISATIMGIIAIKLILSLGHSLLPFLYTS